MSGTGEETFLPALDGEERLVTVYKRDSFRPGTINRVRRDIASPRTEHIKLLCDALQQQSISFRGTRLVAWYTVIDCPSNACGLGCPRPSSSETGEQ